MTTATAPETGASGVWTAPHHARVARHPRQERGLVNTGAVDLAEDASARERVRVYERWLAHETLHAETAAQRQDSPVSLRGYAARAEIEVRDGGRTFRPFAPYHAAYSALRTFTSGQMAALALLALALLLGLALMPEMTLITLLSALTGFYLLDLAITATISTATLRRGGATIIPDEVARAVRDGFWPSYTILCPLYHEAEVASQFVRAMRLIEYPTDRLQVLFLTEEDDVQTREALLAMGLPARFEVVTVPDGSPRTKPRACNYGLMRATGDFVVIFDAEDIPDPLQLKKAALTFAHGGPELACVQASLNFYNPRQNALTRWFTAEYSLWFGLTLPALRRARSFLPLGGTSNHFRARALREVGGWDPFNVTEDCDLGVRLAHYRYRTAMVDSTTYEEANPNLKNWLRQRSRWIKGYMQTYLVHMRNPARYLRERRLGEFFWLQVIVGGRTLVQLINPVLWLMTLAYVVFHQELISPYHLLYPAPLFYVAAFLLVFGNLFYIYMYVIGCLSRGQYTLTLWAVFIPLYWALMSVSAYIALYQLVTRPHYWEKTQHGLSAPGAVAIERALVPSVVATRDTAPAVAWRRALAPWLARVSLASAWLGQGPLEPVITYARGEVTRVRREMRLNRASEARLAPSLALPVAAVVDMLSTVMTPALTTAPSLVALGAPRASRVTRDLRGVSGISRALTVALPAPSRARGLAPRATTLAARGAPSATRAWALPAWLAWARDGWLVATLLTAITASVSACVYFFQRDDLLLYNDSESHMRLARLVFSSMTPGLSQLGSNWLPLPHILMWPFVWNDYLWSTGLAGAFAAMPCYVVAALFTYLCARELTGNGAASYIGALALILNPNVLYLQTTPLSEATLLAVTAATCYYFLRWTRGGELNTLLSAAVCALLGVWTRYEGWSLFAALVAMVVVVGLFKRLSLRRIAGEVTLFALPGLAGMALWLAWDDLLTGNPRYFQNGPYSPAAQQSLLRQAGELPTYHHFWLDILTYGADLTQYFGPLALALGVVGLVFFLAANWRAPLGVAALALLAPVILYIVSLYSGQTVIYVQGVTPAPVSDPVFNVRYATSAAIPLAIFLAQLARMVARWRWATVALALVILAQSALTATGGIISLQDGQRGVSCQGITAVDLFLLEHYNNLPIMLDTFNGPHNFATLGIQSSEVVYAGNYQLWPVAAAHPSAYVDWVVITPGDTVDKAVDTDASSFEDHFVLVFQNTSGVRIYYSRTAPTLPTRPAPSAIMAAYASCPTSVGATPGAGQKPAPSQRPLNGPHARVLPPAPARIARATEAPHAQGVSL